ncbi:PfkB family carbohydrate kinase [Bacteriovoracaceae bacterium]|nr:PfkB family carbohydrate kinase [Bacteriovoracaceae bacterium]|tara:strand:+ start:31958 stop:32986 length:1029 start_codon:yes stop_codon:yes gene_type:complete
MSLITSKRFEEIINKFSDINPFIVVGDVGIDKYTHGSVNRISPEAPVPVLEVQQEWLKLGLAANISHNFQTLGMSSTICGVIGNEDRANSFESLLEDTGLKTWGIIRDPSRVTTYKERITTATQQICRIDYERSEMLSKETEQKVIERLKDFTGDHSAIVIEDYSKGTLTKDLIKRIIDEGKDKKLLVTVDPGRNAPPEFYKGANLLKPNLIEARTMVDSLGYTHEKQSVGEMAEVLCDKLKLEKVVITLGPQGMALFDTLDSSQKEVKIIPTVAPEVFDVSGAGDTTITLLTASLIAGATLEEAAWISNCGAGVVIAKKGTATVNIVELLTFYRKLRETYQ